MDLSQTASLTDTTRDARYYRPCKEKAGDILPDDIVSLVGPVLADIVGELAATTNNHAMMVVPLLLSALSATFGPMAKVGAGTLHPPWQTNVLLWTIVVAPPAAGKTPIIKELSKAISNAEFLLTTYMYDISEPPSCLFSSVR